MTSAVTICSNALLMLGDRTLASFSEEADRVTLASNLWPLVRLSVLRAHPWNAAGKRVVLSPDVATPAFGPYDYQFTVPGDFVRVIAVGEDGEEDYRLEARKLLLNSNVCYLAYVFDQSDPSQWDALLIDAMVHAMAARCAYAITGSVSLAQEMKNAYKECLRAARATDGQENPPEQFGSARWPISRAGGRPG